jgi:hypothetical protein
MARRLSAVIHGPVKPVDDKERRYAEISHRDFARKGGDGAPKDANLWCRDLGEIRRAPSGAPCALKSRSDKRHTNERLCAQVAKR